MASNRDSFYHALGALTRRLRKIKRGQLKRRKAQRSQNRAQLLLLNILVINLFLFEVFKSKHEERVRRNRCKPNDPIEVQYLQETPPTSLYLAKNAKTFDITKAMASEGKLARLSATILYVRYHDLKDSVIARHILPDRLGGKDLAQQLLVTKILKDSNRYQTQIMSFYLAGVYAIIQTINGFEL